MITELIFELVKKFPGYGFTLGYNEKHDWYEVYITYGSLRLSRVIPSWLPEMYSVDTVARTIQAAFEELAASAEMKGEGK